MRTKELISKMLLLLIVTVMTVFSAYSQSTVEYKIINGEAYVACSKCIKFQVPADIPAQVEKDGVVYPVVGFFETVHNGNGLWSCPYEFIFQSTLNLPSTIRDYIHQVENYVFDDVTNSEVFWSDHTYIYSIVEFLTASQYESLSPYTCITSSCRNENLCFVNVDEGGENYSSYNGVLYNADQTELLMVPIGRLEVDNISPRAIKVGRKAAFTSHLEFINLQGNVQEIGLYAFAFSKLKKIIFPENLKSIGKRAFYSVSWDEDTELNFPVGLTDIGDGAFKNADKGITGKDIIEIKKISLPSTLVSIGPSAFANLLPETIEYMTDSPITANWNNFHPKAYSQSTLVVPDEAI